jgi:hypothetical protein
MTYGQVRDFIMTPMTEAQKANPDMISDDFYNMYYGPHILKWTLQETYEMAKPGYLFAMFFEPIEHFWDYAKRKGRDSAQAYKDALGNIEKKYGKIMLDDLVARQKARGRQNGAAATGSSGNTPEEAQHYVGQRQVSKEMEGKINFAYDHAVIDELGGYAEEAIV